MVLPRSGSIDGDLIDLVAEELDAQRAILLEGGEDLDDVAAHAEGAAVKVDVVALVLQIDEPTQQRVAAQLLADLELDDELACNSSGSPMP